MTKVLMLGWEYPPHVTGGLAAATAGVVSGLLGQGIDVELLLPTSAGVATRSGLRVHDLSAPNLPDPYSRPGRLPTFGMHLLDAVEVYAARAASTAASLAFDVIHAHEWLTVAAAMRIAAATGCRWVWHVHATEFDRAAELGHPRVLEVERTGCANADRIVAVSGYTRSLLVQRYGADPERVSVVHNSVPEAGHGSVVGDRHPDGRQVVLFLGRLTFQKGPDYFVEAAREVLTVDPEVLFVVAGEGDMRPRLMDRVASLGLGRSILFTGFVRPEDARRLYGIADLYVMPSVSEPFGITALEALVTGTPVILSKHTGVNEVVRNVLAVDFWDVHQLAGYILAALSYPTLRRVLAARGREDVNRWTWNDAGTRLAQLYTPLLHG